jgi:flagellar motor switch protein FliG
MSTKIITKKRKQTGEELKGCTSALLSALRESHRILNAYSNNLEKTVLRTPLSINSLQNEIEKLNFAFQNLVCLYDRDEQLEILMDELKNEVSVQLAKR